MSTQSPPSPSFRPTPDALVTAVRQHGALGARLIADYWRREGADPSAAAAAVHDAVPQLRTTTVRDVGLSHRAPAPFPSDISGGPLDDLFTANLDRQQRAMQRAAHEARMFGQCLGAEVVTYGVKGVAAIDGAVTQFAARHVDELLRLGEPAGAAVADLGRILAGEPDTLAERQRQVILRLLKPREGERFYGMRPDVRSALALAVLAVSGDAYDLGVGVRRWTVLTATRTFVCETGPTGDSDAPLGVALGLDALTKEGVTRYFSPDRIRVAMMLADGFDRVDASPAAR